MPNLKCIICRSTGYNNIPLKAVQERGIKVCNVPTYGEHTVAEYSFAMLLALSRKIIQAVSFAQQGGVGHQTITGFDLYGKTFGIIGTGKIGCQAARIANGFGMQVVAYDIYPSVERSEAYLFRYVSLETLLSMADVVSLHAPYTKENRHLLNADRLSKMKPGAIVINTARGELIQTNALIECLQSGMLAGAALDVLEGESLLSTPEEIALLRDETLKPDTLKHSLEISILKKLPNVIVTNHNAFNTVEAVRRINETSLNNLYAFLNGTPQNEVHL